MIKILPLFELGLQKSHKNYEFIIDKFDFEIYKHDAYTPKNQPTTIKPTYNKY